MKSIIRVLVAILLCSSATYAGQKSDVPASIKAAFATQYPGATKTKWETEGDKYEVSFLAGGKHMSVLYGASGNAEETETQITVAELPAKAKKYALSKGKIKEAAKIVTMNGTIKYEAEVKGKDLLFDTQGNFLESRDQ